MKLTPAPALFVIACLYLLPANAQEIIVEKDHELESLKKDTYIGDAYFDPQTEETKLVYVEMDPFKSSFVTYTFDKNLDYVGEEKETYTFKDQMDELRQQYPWFKYKGDDYTVKTLSVDRLLGGKIRVLRQTVTYTWKIGMYWPKVTDTEVVKVKGLDNEKLYLYDYISNYETGEVLMLVGLKGDKFSQCREFQLIKVGESNEVEYLEKISFEHNMGISFNDVLRLAETEQQTQLAEEGFRDIYEGKWVMMLSPLGTMLGRKYKSKDPDLHHMLIINEDGSINTSQPVNPPTAGWVVEDYVMSDDGSTVFFYGPAKTNEYVNNLMPVQSPLISSEEVKEIKYKEFQVMKMVDNDIAWIKSTNIDEFKKKAVGTPSGGRKTPFYTGKKFTRTNAFINPYGELLITGQEWNIPFGKEERNYLDLIMFHFNDDGSLKAQYGVKRENNNAVAKANLTPQDLYYNEDGTELYWVYGEIDGYRQGLKLGGGILEAAGVGTLRKGKLLYYPAVGKINFKEATLTDFVYPGSNSKGRQKFYTNPEFPQYFSSSSNTLTFFGEDKKGKRIWLARMKLD